MTWIFEVRDKSGRKIHLSRERWKHIVNEHPDVTDKLYEIEEIIENSLIIKMSKYDKNVRFYYKHYKNLKQKSKYLLVAVKYLNGIGYIITSFYVNAIRK
tara:strand:- start:732 stop:1031 length:300 start_codon:yes stop_codon:yes gene_type:complete